MRDEQHRAGVLLQSFLQEAASIQVQVRRRFVQQKEVRRGQIETQEREADLLAARKHARRLLHVVLVEPERAHQIAEVLLVHPRRNRVLGVAVDRHVRRNRLGELLAQIAGYHVVPQNRQPARRLPRAGDDAHERRLAQPVVADERHLVAADDLKADIVQHLLLPVVRKAQMLAAEHLQPARRRFRQAQASGLGIALGQDDALFIQLVDEFLARLRLGGLRRLGAEAVHEPLQLLAVAVLVLLGRLEMAVADLPLLEVVVQTALVARHRAGVHLDRDGGQRAQEVAVVRNEHERPFVRLQELLQPLHGGQVEVVRRLVQEKQVRTRRQDARKLGAHAPAARETHERLLEVFRRETQPAQGDLDARLDVVSAQVLEFRLEFAVALQLRRVREVRLERRHLRLHLGKTRDALERVVQKRLAGRVGGRILPRPADARILFDDEFARVGRKFPQNDLEKRRLAAPVRADNPHAVAFVHAKGDPGQNVLMSIVDGNVPKIEHSSSIVSAKSLSSLYYTKYRIERQPPCPAGPVGRSAACRRRASDAAWRLSPRRAGSARTVTFVPAGTS